MCRSPVSTPVSLLLLLAACAHRGSQRREPADAGGNRYCVVRPPAPAAPLPSYTLATVRDSALARVHAGQIVLHVDSSGREDRPVPHAIVTLTPPTLASAAPVRAVPASWGQADSAGRVVLPPVAAGRYAGELLAGQYHPWTGPVDVRAGHVDTLRIGMSAKTPAGVVVARCR